MARSKTVGAQISNVITPAAPVYLFYNSRMPAAKALAERLVTVAEAHNHPARVAPAEGAETLLAPHNGAALLLSLGGDGTILRVARAAATHLADPTPPLLAIDFGQVGFLTELSPAEAETGLNKVLAGDYWLESRHLLRAYLTRNGEVVEEALALNDVVLARGDGPHAIRLSLSIDDAETMRYTADGMVVASPTGSTAYALAAGGPIIHPTMNVMLAIPVAPHLAVARGFVVPAESRVSLRATAYRSTVVTLDGQITIPYESDDILTVTTSPQTVHFVRLGARNYFYSTLHERLRRS